MSRFSRAEGAWRELPSKREHLLRITLELLHQGRSILVTTGQVTFGRTQGCTVRVVHPLVSREHCRLSIDSTGAFLEDLGSSNGTWLNGSRVDHSTRVRAGDSFTLGRSGPEMQVVRAEVAGADVSRWEPEGLMQTMMAGDPRAGDFEARVSVAREALPALEEEEIDEPPTAMAGAPEPFDDADTVAARPAGFPAGPPASALRGTEDPTIAAPRHDSETVEPPLLSEPVLEEPEPTPRSADPGTLTDIPVASVFVSESEFRAMHARDLQEEEPPSATIEVRAPRPPPVIEPPSKTVPVEATAAPHPVRPAAPEPARTARAPGSAPEPQTGPPSVTAAGPERAPPRKPKPSPAAPAPPPAPAPPRNRFVPGMLVGLVVGLLAVAAAAVLRPALVHDLRDLAARPSEGQGEAPR